jgi:hypothetical protein
VRRDAADRVLLFGGGGLLPPPETRPDEDGAGPPRGATRDVEPEPDPDVDRGAATRPPPLRELAGGGALGRLDTDPPRRDAADDERDGGLNEDGGDGRLRAAPEADGADPLDRPGATRARPGAASGVVARPLVP